MYFADAGGADKDSLIKGFLGGYIPSACMLGYTSFVTGEQDTMISKVYQDQLMQLLLVRCSRSISLSHTRLYT